MEKYNNETYNGRSNIKVKLFFIFLIIIASVYLLLIFEKEQKFNTLLNKQSLLVSALHNTFHKNYQEKSKIIFNSIINKSEIKDSYKLLNFQNKGTEKLEKNKLEIILNNYHQTLKDSKVKSIYFYSKTNNNSFKVQINDENLKIVPQDNNNLKDERFKEINFTFKLKDLEDKHLSNIEISFDILNFNSWLSKEFDVTPNFYSNEEITKDKSIPSEVLSAIKENKTISVFDTKTDDLITTYLPILDKQTNELLGLFSIAFKDEHIKSESMNFYLIFVIMTIFTTIIFYFLLKEFGYKDRVNKVLKQKVKEETFRLNQQKNFLDTLIQSSPVPFFYKNRKGEYTNVNQVWSDFTGFSKEEIIGKSVYDVAPKEIADIYFEQDQKVFSLEENPQIYESKVVNKNTKNVSEVMFYKSAFIDESGEVQGIIGFLTDLTKIKQLQEDTLKKEKIFFEQSKMASMGEMIGNIAHQWRQPLSVISTAASGLKMKYEFDDVSPEDIPEYTDTIVRNTKYLSETIDTFRNFIKEQKGKKRVILQDKIDESLRLLKASLENANIKLINNMNYNEPIEVEIISEELSQVIINIINNSIDAVLHNKIENGTVEVNIVIKDDLYKITIEDNAGGIKEEILSKIFEPYFTTKHKFQGTGLGLYMSKTIIEKHFDGKLYAKNTDKGAKFIIEFPKQ